jgi:hypothetical protein
VLRRIRFQNSRVLAAGGAKAKDDECEACMVENLAIIRKVLLDSGQYYKHGYEVNNRKQH